MNPKEALAFVERHGIVLQAARGPVPNLAEAIAGGPVRGSWWGHPKGKEIFRAAKVIYESPNVLVCKRRSVTDYAHRRLIDESARRRTSTGPVDFMPINDSNWRDGLGADRFEFNTLRDKRPGDKNRPFFNFLLRLRSLVDVRIGKHRSGKQCRDNSCSS